MTTTASFIRYPGSKAKLVEKILDVFPEHLTFGLLQAAYAGTYCEPFLGAGAMLSRVIDGFPRKTVLHLNDKDYWLVCLWKAVLECPHELSERIDDFVPEGDAFYRFKKQDGSKIDPVEAGFRKLALHQISFSGLGFMAGGPLGGKAQNNSEYNPACRWRPERLKKKIRALHRALARFHNVAITCRDFAAVLKPLPKRAFAYLDPPYYEKGEQLYKHNMEDADHVRLAGLLRSARFAWVLSYDDNERIRTLYDWARIREVEVTYTTATSTVASRPKNRELLITPA